jgi:aryl-alcohol dehydrogenase-like predicted oxidoreductase
MDYRTLGRTGTHVSALCLGCMMFGGRTDPAESMDIIDRAIDAGINFLDTANVYSRGRSEEAVGQALRRNGKRSRIILATKVHGRMDDDDPNAAGNHRQHIIQQAEASLQRLQTDYIDLYQIHRPQSSIPIDETLRALDDLVHSGKVRYIGTSTYAAWQLMEAVSVAREWGLNRFVSEQPPYHLLIGASSRDYPLAEPTHAIIPGHPWRRFLRASIIVVDPGKNTATRPQDTYTFSFPRPLPRAGLVEALRRKGAHSRPWALACDAAPAVTAPIIGPRTVAQLETTWGAEITSTR